MELSPKFMFCKKLRKRSKIQHKKIAEISIVQKNSQCSDIRFPMSQNYVEKVLTLQQCQDIATTSAEKGKAKICQCRNIITTLSRHQVNVATTQLNVATPKAASTVKLHQTSNVATLPRHGYDIGCSEKN